MAGLTKTLAPGSFPRKGNSSGVSDIANHGVKLDDIV